MKLGIANFGYESKGQENPGSHDSGIRSKESLKRNYENLERVSGVRERPLSYAGRMYELIGQKRRALLAEHDELQSRLGSLVDFKSAVGKVKNVTETVVDTSPEDSAYGEVRDRLVQINGQLELLRLKQQEVELEAEEDPELRAEHAKELIALQGKMLELEGQYGMLDLHEGAAEEPTVTGREAVGAEDEPFEDAA